MNIKVLLLNGSPHHNGCTYTALAEIAKTLSEYQIESEIFYAGKQPVRGCTSCGQCRRTNTLSCVYDDDIVNAFIEKAKQFDGFIFGSPVHYAGPSGTVKSMLDRAFFAGGKIFYNKPGSAIVSCRRAGSTAALETLNKYLATSNMVFVTSQYWNMVHGSTPDEVRQDLEGMQAMRTLGQNMAWLLLSIEAGRKQGIALPKRESPVRTNFVRTLE